MFDESIVKFILEQSTVSLLILAFFWQWWQKEKLRNEKLFSLIDLLKELNEMFKQFLGEKDNERRTK